MTDQLTDDPRVVVCNRFRISKAGGSQMDEVGSTPGPLRHVMRSEWLDVEILNGTLHGCRDILHLATLRIAIFLTLLDYCCTT